MRWQAARVATLDRAAEAVGAQSVEAVPDRIAALQAELRETKRLLKAGGGGGIPRPAELAALAVEAAPGVAPGRVRRAVRLDRCGQGRAPRTSAACCPRASSPSRSTATSRSSSSRSATTSWPAASPRASSSRRRSAAIDGRGGGSPAMAQGKGTKREGVAAALAAVSRALEASG